MLPKRFKDALPENDKAGLLALGLVLLMISQYLADAEKTLLIILRYASFAAALILYGYVFYVHNKERVEKKRQRKSAKDN